MSCSRDSIELELSKGWRERRSVELVRLYDADDAHYRYARQTTIVAAVNFMSLALVEPFILPNMLIASPLIRLTISPLVLAFLLWFIARRPPLIQIHHCLGMTVVLATAIWSGILLAGSDGGPNYYFLCGFLFFLTANIFMRLKFEAAAISNLLVFAIMALDAFLLPGASVQLLLIDLMMVLITIVMTLYANWALDRKSYAIFLHQLIGALDRKELAKRNHELLTLSSTDALTGIGNRRAAEAAIEALWLNYKQRGQPFALAIIDVDFFKLYNDHHGHGAGDDCLKAVAAAARKAAGEFGARVFRLGGEEFIVTIECDLPDTALRVANAVLDAVGCRQIPHRNGPDALHRISGSIGVARVDELAAKGVADVMEAADIALYRAKSAGRNQAVLFTSDMRADRYPATVEAAQVDPMTYPRELIAADKDMVLTAA
jgi:diguanylate cyclase (GGDEF)-like protein